MPRESKSMRLDRIHAEAIEEFGTVYDGCADERRQCMEDRRFASIAGAQWEGPLSGILEGHPRMEFNKVQAAVVRIVNEMRAANIGMTWIARDPDAELDDALADLCSGKMRADEYDSNASEAFGNAFEEAITGGMGAFLVRADYVDEDDDKDERQRVCFEPIYDADSSVFFDTDAKEQTKRDAKRCWVIRSMTPASYMAEYDRPDPSTWPKDTSQRQFDWSTPDVVYVCEYYRKEKRKVTVEVWMSPAGEERLIEDDDYESDEDYQAEVDRITPLGWVLVRKEKRERKEVRKYILDGQSILEDCGPIAGKCIPVIPVYGKRWYIDNVERMAGGVRYVKDAQRLKNMQLSKLAEIAALSAREKPIVTSEQIAGHEVRWADDNISDFPYLTINTLYDVAGNPLPQGPLAYTKPPSIPPALAALVAQTEGEIREILGEPEQANQLQSNVSGEAISLVQQRVDGMGAIYLTNYAKAREAGARVWLDIATEVYVEEGRSVRVMSDDNEVSFKKINLPKKGKDGVLLEGSDFERAKFDVYAKVGPNSSSSRQATVRALTGMMQMTQDPEDMKILLSMALANMEGEGVTDVRRFYRKRLVTMGVVPPTEQEQAEMVQAQQNQAPDPQAVFLASEAEKNQAQAQKYAAETRETVANTAKIEAETVKTMVETRQGGG